MTTRDTDHDAGFSLVELLVGLILISILIATLSALAGQFRNLIRGTDEATERAALEATVRKISEILEQAETLPVEIVEGALSHFLEGTESQVKLVATASLGVTHRGLRTATISRNEDGALILALQYRRVSRPSKEQEQPTVLVLNEAISTVKFSYFGQFDGSVKPQWRDEWSKPGQLPLAIITSISAEIGNGRAISASSIATLQSRKTNY